MGLEKKVITTYLLSSPTNNTHIIMSTKIAHTKI